LALRHFQLPEDFRVGLTAFIEPHPLCASHVCYTLIAKVLARLLDGLLPLELLVPGLPPVGEDAIALNG